MGRITRVLIPPGSGRRALEDVGASGLAAITVATVAAEPVVRFAGRTDP